MTAIIFNNASVESRKRCFNHSPATNCNPLFIAAFRSNGRKKNLLNYYDCYSIKNYRSSNLEKKYILCFEENRNSSRRVKNTLTLWNEICIDSSCRRIFNQKPILLIFNIDVNIFFTTLSARGEADSTREKKGCSLKNDGTGLIRVTDQ